MPGMFLENNAVDLIEDLVADGTAEVVTDVLDMSGYDEITFIVKHGDVDAAAVMTYTVKENSANSTSSPTPTAVSLASGTSVGALTPTLTSGAAVITESSGNLDDKLICINVKANALSKRYVFLSITCADESHEIDSIIAIRSCARSVPVTQSSDVAVGVTYGS